MLSAQRLKAEENTFIIPDVTKTDLIMLYHRTSLDSKIVFNICQDNFERARDGRSWNRLRFVRIFFLRAAIKYEKRFFVFFSDFQVPSTTYN